MERVQATLTVRWTIGQETPHKSPPPTDNGIAHYRPIPANVLIDEVGLVVGRVVVGMAVLEDGEGVRTTICCCARLEFVLDLVGATFALELPPSIVVSTPSTARTREKETSVNEGQ